MYDRALHTSFLPASCRAGQCTGSSILLAGILGVLLACGSDKSAPQTGTGGTGDEEPAAAAGRANRGEGYEPTPTFDITNPQRPVPPRDQLIEGVNMLYGNGGSSGSGGTPDAGGADAGPDAAP